ncbi:MAG: ATP-binding protein [Ignavibacteriales bacterium]|nr:ATP-binding protein [Ignavibacteriales bacterium]
MNHSGIFSKTREKLSVAFADQIKEEKFLNQQRDNTAEQLRWACLVGALIMIGFIWQDTIISETGHQAIMIRILGALPVSALAWYLSRKLAVRRFISYITALFWLSYTCLTAALFISYGSGPYGLTSSIGLGSFLIIIFGIFTFSNLRLWATILVGMSTLLVYTISVALWTESVFVDFIMGDFLTVVALMIGTGIKTLFTERAQRRQFETSEQLNKSYTMMEQQVRERTADLQDTNTMLIAEVAERKHLLEEIIKAKEKAEEMSRLKSSFLANMSHELRTPLNGILGFAEIMKEQLTDENFKGQAKIIFESGNRLKQTLDLILNLSKIESETLEVYFEEVELTEYVLELVKVFEKSAEAIGIELKVITGKELLFSNLDKILLNSIINNLLNNAIKYTPKGKVTVEINKIIDDEKMNVEFLVTDTGIGIVEENLAIIFEPFRQASEGWNRKYEGTGLGLTLVKKYAESMHGEITVESKVGVGSAFRVKFPLIKVAFKKSEKAEIETKEEKYVVEIKKVGEPLILYVEDDLVSQKLIKTLVASSYNIDCIADGEGAIELVKRNKYDIILMDINLGGKLNGIETIKLLQKIKGYRKIPIIAITVYAMAGDKEKLLSEGCTHYISKPFAKSEFLSLLKEALNWNNKN